MNLFPVDFLFAEVFIPHGHCFLWNPKLVWLHLLSDALIGLSYFSIPFALIYFVTKRKDVPYPWIFILFSAFIIACGTSHLMSIWTLWHPNYWVSGWIKFLTAIISVITAGALIPVLPNALAIPSRDELEETAQALRFAKEELEQRVTERTQELRVSEERLMLALDGSGDGFWDWDIRTDQVYLSPRWLEMLGYSEGELPGNLTIWKTLTHPDDAPMVMQKLEAHLQGSNAPLTGSTHQYEFDYRLQTKSGDWKWVGNYGKVVAYDDQGKPIRMAGTHKDISERKNKEIIIANSLAEKEVLLREIHHRVKNNLQIIRSLLSLQSKRSKDENVISILKESQDRILSMALIHEKLYRASNFSHVDFGDYLRDLFDQLFRSYRNLAKNIEFKDKTIHDVYLNIDLAIPCGLIVNEIVTNSLKHAFPQQKSGTISLQINSLESDGVLIEVADDGIGCPISLDSTKNETLGFQMINVLIRQVSGEIRSFSNPGTRYEIKLPFHLPSGGQGL